MRGTLQSPRALSLAATAALAVVLGSGIRDLRAQGHQAKGAKHPIVLAEQGSFAFGGTVHTNTEGRSLHCDHGYTEYQTPPKARNLPLIMWHSTSTKTWTSTPGGQEGFQDIFLRRGFAVHIIDLPRQGRAGNACVSTTYTPNLGQDQSTFVNWRLGTWNLPGPPTLFPNSQAPRGAAFLNQILRARYPDNENFADTDQTEASAVAALLDEIGPATLFTHSGSGRYGWLAALRSPKVKGIVSFEPSVYVFPPGERPPPNTRITLEVSLAEFEKLTRIPILLVFADFLNVRQASIDGLANGRAFVAALNRHGGNGEVLVLPEVGIFGNSHVMMLERNNVQIADLVSRFLHQKGLDKRKGA
jgi:pimeloyl-ACP methyl ester carboxylesterase